MDSQQFAETILFSPEIEKKLTRPDNLSFSGRPIASCELPARSSALKFESKMDSVPSIESCENDQQRAKLLHYFANHELLAIELMALALARFTRAPESFRRGLCNTIIEEQNHFMMYRQAINEIGYEFGDFKVNGFFWQVLRDMQSPADYIGQMSLTFEQANLDYCTHFIKVFEQIGEEKTVRILQNVYEDEIGHVRFGVRWFEKVTGAELNFENYNKSLKWPITPVWGKAKKVNRKARIKAGLSEEFIDKMELFHRTRGRAPNIFFFYPGAENHCFSKPKSPPPKHFIEMWQDLQLLPYIFAKTDDAVLLSKLPEESHVRRLRSYGLPAVEFIGGFDCNFTGSIPQGEKRKFTSLQPWGWDEYIGKKFESLYFADSAPKTSKFRDWYAKTEILRWMSNLDNPAPYLVDEEDIGICIDKTSSIPSLLERWPHYEKFVIKGEFGYSGLSQRVISRSDSVEALKLAADSIFARQSRAILEPWYDKQFDYSVQIDVLREGGYRFRGLARFLTDDKGRYIGAKLGRFDQGLSQEQIEFVHRYKLPFETETQAVADSLRALGYFGPAGIDGLVFKDTDGQLRHRFGLEVNPRWNMGRLAVELQKKMAPGRIGQWRLIDRAEVSSFSSFANKAEELFPAKLTRGFWDQGAFLLTDPSLASRKLGVVFVHHNSKELTKMADKLCP